MSSVSTANKEKTMIFETVLSSPGMNEKCKINLAMSRRNILLLCRLIEAGIMAGKNNSDDEIISAFPKESLEEIKLIQADILAKGGLAEFYEKLKQFN